MVLRTLPTHKLLLMMLLLWSILVAFDVEEIAADDLDKSRQQLIDIEQQLEKTLADITRKEAAENDVIKDLDSVDRQLNRLKKRVAKEKKHLISLNETISAEKNNT